MEKIFRWIKEHKILAIFTVVIIFFFPILVVHILFKLPSRYEFWIAEWSAGDILSYVSGFYALLGTIIFSMITLYQNHIINKRTEQYNKILSEMEFKRDMPILQIRSSGCNGNCSNLRIKINNISDNIASNVKISNLVVNDINGEKLHHTQNVEIQNSTISANSLIEENLKTPVLHGSNLKICFYLEYKDKFLNSHIVKATGVIWDSNNYKEIDFKTEDKLINDDF